MASERTLQEATSLELAKAMNEMMLDPIAKSMEVLSASIRMQTKLLLDALDAGAASLAAGRKLLETIQRTAVETSDAAIGVGTANMQGLIKMAESIQSCLGTRKV